MAAALTADHRRVVVVEQLTLPAVWESRALAGARR